MHRESMNNRLNVIMMEKSAGLDVSFFDMPTYYNEMQDASSNAPLISQTAFQVFDFLRFAVQLIVAVVLMLEFSPLFAILLSVSIIPNVIFQRKQLDSMYAWQRHVMSDERKLYYLSSILTSGGF